MVIIPNDLKYYPTSFITSLTGYGLPVLSQVDFLTSSDCLIASSIPVELTCGL
eukprot:SAG22_NODE_4913_length_1133_cov_6.645068_1_plen_52_part_01